jgi:hypothetical protein
MAENLLQYFIWLSGVVVGLALIAAMLYKRRRASFPWFFQYIIYQTGVTALLFVVFHAGSYASYYYAYWTTAAVGTILAFCVLHEIFTVAFKPYPSLQQLGSLLFRWGSLVVVIFASVMALSNFNSTVDALTNAIMTMERSVRLMQCGLVLLLLFFSRHLGLTFRHPVLGISTGLGAVAAINLILVSLRTGGWMTSELAYSVILTSSYALTLSAWTGYMLAPEPVRRPVLAEPASAAWDSALAGLGGGTTSSPADDALLVRMEAAVDRAFARPGNKVYIRSVAE